MANSISNRTFPVGVRVPFVRFCQSIQVKVDLLSTDDGSAFRIQCAATDYPFVTEAADVIEASQAAEAAWLAEYLSNLRMKPCAVGAFSDPLSRRLEEISRDHWHNSGRAERVRLEYEAATAEMKRVARKPKVTTGTKRVARRHWPVEAQIAA
ncbi:MAG: hypothetical protein K2Q28_04820 [Hyphomicrobium sp.]|nr:hypothetical protein [Hyphomicrobium sp.]